MQKERKVLSGGGVVELALCKLVETLPKEMPRLFQLVFQFGGCFGSLLERRQDGGVDGEDLAERLEQQLLARRPVVPRRELRQALRGEGDEEGEMGSRDEPPLLFAAEDVGGGSAAAACAEALRRAAGRRAVLFRHSHDRHGLISGVLRPGGGLAALLEEAVSI